MLKKILLVSALGYLLYRRKQREGEAVGNFVDTIKSWFPGGPADYEGGIIPPKGAEGAGEEQILSRWLF